MFLKAKRNFLFFHGWNSFPCSWHPFGFFFSVMEMIFTLLLVVWNVLINLDLHCLFLAFCSFNCSSPYLPDPFITCLLFSYTMFTEPFFVALAHCIAKKDNILRGKKKKKSLLQRSSAQESKQDSAQQCCLCSWSLITSFLCDWGFVFSELGQQLCFMCADAIICLYGAIVVFGSVLLWGFTTKSESIQIKDQW